MPRLLVLKAEISGPGSIYGPRRRVGGAHGARGAREEIIAGPAWGLKAPGQGGWMGIMKPSDMQAIGDELAVKWEDGSESFVPLEKLRRACPCAACKGETDVLGHLHKGPERPYSPGAFLLVRIVNVGSYAVQPIWGDGHQTGIYPFKYLRKLAHTA
jgi:DUF971 family protein